MNELVPRSVFVFLLVWSERVLAELVEYRQRKQIFWKFSKSLTDFLQDSDPFPFIQSFYGERWFLSRLLAG